jgi:hypothetical protein
MLIAGIGIDSKSISLLQNAPISPQFFYFKKKTSMIHFNHSRAQKRTERF